jgi:hypothetical protein
MMMLSNAQYEQLLKPLNRQRVAKREGMSYLEAWDVRAHLTRIFGFGGWSFDVLSADVAMEYLSDEPNRSGKRNWNVGYKVVGRLTIYGIRLDGGDVTFTEASVGASHQPDLGEAHDMAVKTAESDALKRCAVNLGTQFGLSLYDNGATRDVVGRTLDPTFHDETTTITEVPVSPADAPEAPEGTDTPTEAVSPVSDPEGAAEWVARLREAMADGDVTAVVGIKTAMQAADVADTVYEGKTLGKMADLAVVHAGKVAAGRRAAAEKGEEVTA